MRSILDDQACQPENLASPETPADAYSPPEITMRHRHRAFTLVELLTSIGIIAVLVAIVLPAVSRTRVSAGRIACASQLRQIGQLMRMYLNDNDDRLPNVRLEPWVMPLPGEPVETIVQALQPRDGDKRIWICPADRFIQSDPAFVLPTGTTPARYADLFESSYQYHPAINVFAGNDRFGATMSRIGHAMGLSPDRLWVFREHAPFHGKAGAQGASNYLMADWHVGDLQ